jgi:hypothetical protein
MKCQEIVRKLSSYQDKELSISDNHQIEIHLKTCDECNHAYIALTSLKKKYTQIPDISTPQNFSSLIMGKINDGPVQTPGKFLTLTLYGFFFLLLIGFGFLFQANISLPNLNNHQDYLKNEPLISMVVNKDDTSIISFSEDICKSLLTDGVKNGK